MRCGQCQNNFKPTREWQLFCCSKCKVQYNREHKEFCFYCGLSGNHRDHIHPVSVRGGQRRFLGQEHVWACSECNVTLSDNLFDDLVARFQHLLYKYDEKYKNLLRAVRWDEEEIEELGPALKTTIRRALKEKWEVEERMAYIKAAQVRVYKLFKDKEDELSEEESK